MCQRCVKAKIPCEGYAKDLKFVDEKGRAQKRVQIKREAYLQSIQAEDERIRALREHRRSSVNIPPELPLKRFQEHIEMSHMDSKLFADAKMIAPWSMEAYSGRESCSTTQTMRALGSMYYGRMHRDKESLDQSMIHYGKAIRLLASDLQDVKRVFKLQTLTNVLSLAIFEVVSHIISPERSNYLYR